MATSAPEQTENQQVKSCSIKLLPTELWHSAAQKAVEVNPANAPALHQFRHAFPDVVLPVAYIALMTSKYWGAGGISLGVGFLDNPPADLRARILGHMNAWSQFANVSFTETNNNPEV